MPWTPKINPKQLKKQHDELALRLLRVREELQTSERHRVGLEVLLDVRGERIDELIAQIDRLRQQNQKLDAEAEHLAQLFRENATSAPK
jgi:hypothetical protein